ncbi:MAG TPA: TonB family protein [Gammaproteobacteria bacterium]|nr:TonB family protein [Gammaproteobacteria bacterium]
MIVGFLVAGLLFWIMRSFISGQQSVPTGGEVTQIVNFVQAPKQEEIQHKQRDIPDKPKPQQPPPEAPKVHVSKAQKVQTPQVNINIPNIGVPTPGAGGSGPYLGSGGFNVSNLSANGQAIPIVAITPQYPASAMFSKLEGHVTLEFTIQPDGSATDPEVIDSEPRRVFDKAAINALLRSKFKPKVVNGKPIASRGTFTYQFHLPKNRR